MRPWPLLWIPMLALVLAIGLVVDDAIVIGESVFTEKENQPMPPCSPSVKCCRP